MVLAAPKASDTLFSYFNPLQFNQRAAQVTTYMYTFIGALCDLLSPLLGMSHPLLTCHDTLKLRATFCSRFVTSTSAFARPVHVISIQSIQHVFTTGTHLHIKINTDYR